MAIGGRTYINSPRHISAIMLPRKRLVVDQSTPFNARWNVMLFFVIYVLMETSFFDFSRFFFLFKLNFSQFKRNRKKCIFWYNKYNIIENEIEIWSGFLSY